MYKRLFLLRIIFADFSSALVTQILYVNIPLFWKFLLLRQEKKRCYFSHGPPYTLYFRGIVCPKTCFLNLIYYYPNSMSKTDSFKKFFICDAPYKSYFESIRFSGSSLLILLWHWLICLKLIYKFKLLPE